MFSIVIPLYNKENNIKQTLESVLNQTFTDFEIVIVNDGSTDKSRDAVLELSDPRIKLIDQENAGVSAARNKGISESKGEWIAFLDADDIWKTNKLEEVANAIKQNNEISWLVTGLETIKGNQIKQFLYDKEGLLDDVLDDLINGLYIQTSSVVVNKQLFVDNPNLLFRVGVNHSEDREVWYKLILRYPKMFYIKKVLAVYFRDTTGNSLTSKKNIQPHFLELRSRLDDELATVTEERKIKFSKFLAEFDKKAIFNIWINYGFYSFFENKMGKRKTIIMKLFSKSPVLLKKIIFKLIY